MKSVEAIAYEVDEVEVEVAHQYGQVCDEARFDPPIGNFGPVEFVESLPQILGLLDVIFSLPFDNTEALKK